MARRRAESPTGDVWAGTREGELWQFRDGKWQEQSHSPHGHPITVIEPGADKSLWVGSEGDGLYRVDEAVPVRWVKQSGLSSAWIRTLYLDPEGILWAGTAGGGLSRLEGQGVCTFTTREGLPDNTISQIVEDNTKNLWLGGNRGIVRVKKSDLNELAAHKIPAIYPQVYGRADGMLSEECTGGFSPAGLKTKAGLLWFSTLKGIVVADPYHPVNARAPAVVLEQPLVDGVADAALGAAGAADEIRTLKLTPGRHRLEFHYTGLSFDAPERVRFRYRLEGLDSDWVEAGTRRAAFYAFVPPGAYRFRVIACNGDGMWNSLGASLGVIVRPYFWQTWWFVTVSVLGTVIAGAAGARVVEKRRTQQRVKGLEQERALERERTRIAQDLHDMMGAKLCRISFLSEHARRSAAVPAELQEEVSSISDDSREVLQSLDEVVWAVNPENDSLEHLASYLGQYAQEYFRRTGIECEVSIPPRLPAQPLSSQLRHHLFLAVREALANILKHSGAKQARIVMTCNGADFEIAVLDNGAGFEPSSAGLNPTDAAAGFGNGLNNIRRRLAELGGNCRVESHPGQGTAVRFVISFNRMLGQRYQQ